MKQRRPVKVAFLVAGFETGGAERQMMAIAERVPKDRVQIEFILFAVPGQHIEQARAAGLQYVELGLGRLRQVSPPRAAFQLIRMAVRYILTVRRRRYDIVDAWLWHGAAIAAFFRPLAGPPVFLAGRRSLSAYKQDFGPTFRFMDAIARRRADLIVANSGAVRDDVIAREHVDPARIRVIRNGVEDAEPMPPAMRASVREGWGFGPDQLVIGTVAVLKPRKGLEGLIRVATELLPRHPELRFAVIGDGRHRATLEGLIEAAGIGDRFRLLGWVEDPRRVYGALDMLVHASEAEGLPNVVLEAAVAARPIVATAAGGTPEIVLDGETGLLVPVGDEPALAAAIERLVVDPELRERLAAGARAYALRTFGMDRLIEETTALYESLVAG